MNNKVVIGGNLKLKNVISGTPNNVIKVGGTGGGGISDEVKEALLDCFEHVAWIDEEGQVYYQALYDALYAKAVTSITAVFDQGQAVIYDDDSLDDLKEYLTVTATYDDGTKAVVTDYTLSGTLNPGTSSIGVTYNNKKVYFTVNVTHRPGIVTITNDLNGCTTSNDATSTTEGESYSATITASTGYIMTGASVSITMGGVDITSSAYSNGSISIAEVTGSLVITITAVAVTLVSISAVYTQSGTVYDTDTLNSLKANLVVTATYSDSSTATVPSDNYALSGTLAEGTSTITVTYQGKTTTFTVTVTHYEATIVTDGLVTYFDLRTTSYNNAGSGGKTVIYSSDDNYSTFAWASNGVSQQDAQKGMLFANGRVNVIASTKDGTTARDTGSEWTEIILVYNQLPKLSSGYVGYNNVSGIEFGAPYTDTNNTKKTVSTKTSVDIGYRGNNGTYMPIIGRASATKFEVFDRTGEIVYTKNASDISDFQSWVTTSGFTLISTTNGWCMFYALYNKALSDAQVLQMVEYMESIEVTEE